MMIKTVPIAILAFCFAISCNNPESNSSNAGQNDTTQNNAANPKESIAPLNEALKKYEAPSQLFKLRGDQPGVVKGKRGTVISVNPNDLVTVSGKPLGATIEVELKELMNQSQLMSSNTQTISDGKLLVSGGAYYIGMTSNNEALKLKPGKQLQVAFPKISEKEMALFYGQRNDLGQINWQQAPETFKVKKAVPQPAKDGVAAVKPARKSDLDAITDYVNSGDTSTTPEERATIAAQQKTAKIRQKEERISENVYDAIGINQLGWINCDRFLENENNTTLSVHFKDKDQLKNASVFLVFKDINSVIQEYYYLDESLQFYQVPIGYKVRLIAYTVKNDRVFAHSQDLTIAKDQNLTLALKEIKEQEFKKLTGN